MIFLIALEIKMASREELEFKIREQRAAISGGWLYQAYLKYQHRSDISSLLSKSQRIITKLKDHIVLQESVLSETLLITEGTSEWTPRL